MGCDIHASIEFSMWDDGEYWSWGKDICIRRNYALFSALADVRNGFGIKPISQPRGLPGDVSYEIKELYEADMQNLGVHNASWVSSEELSDVKKIIDARGNQSDDLDLIIYVTGKLKNGRLVFWFDN
jgi:hypothetical protein